MIIIAVTFIIGFLVVSAIIGYYMYKKGIITDSTPETISYSVPDPKPETIQNPPRSTFDTLPDDINWVSGYNGTFENIGGGDQTMESCRQLGLQSDGKYVAWGYRNENALKESDKRTCFLYHTGFEPYAGDPEDEVHVTGCLNPGEKVNLGCRIPSSDQPTTHPNTGSVTGLWCSNGVYCDGTKIPQTEAGVGSRVCGGDMIAYRCIENNDVAVWEKDGECVHGMVHSCVTPIPSGPPSEPTQIPVSSPPSEPTQIPVSSPPSEPMPNPVSSPPSEQIPNPVSSPPSEPTPIPVSPPEPTPIPVSPPEPTPIPVSSPKPPVVESLPLTFYIRGSAGYESVRYYYSSAYKSLGSAIGSDNLTKTMKKKTFNIPSGARYFVINFIRGSDILIKNGEIMYNGNNIMSTADNAYIRSWINTPVLHERVSNIRDKGIISFRQAYWFTL